jgi:hypothetical protein
MIEEPPIICAQFQLLLVCGFTHIRSLWRH